MSEAGEGNGAGKGERPARQRAWPWRRGPRRKSAAGTSAADGPPAGRRLRLSPAAAEPPRVAGSLLRLFIALAVSYSALAGGLAYWQVVESNRLTTDPLNPLVLSAARQAPRGSIFDAAGNVLARNVPAGNGEQRREYPLPAVAPVVGYRSHVFGTAGLEHTYDAQLTGLLSLRPGDDLLRKFRQQPYNPADLVLSLDTDLQNAAANLLGNQRGAVVALEPTTGRILALASSPTFDPNRIVDQGGRRFMAELRERGDSPLLNRATQGLYVPGSVFKIVTAVAGIGSGTINAQTTFETQPEEYDTGFLVSGFRIHDFPRRALRDHPLDFYEATEVSSNIWFAHAGLTIGPAVLKEAAGRLGFGQPIPFELPTSPSQVTSGDGSLDGFRDEVELATAAFGQGEVLVTPLQMAMVAATVGNHGLLMKPKLVDELRAQDGTVTALGPAVWGQVIGAGEAQVVAEAMLRAVEGRFAFASGARVPGVPTAGKSGTAELAGNAPPHSWFIGYAPADAPEIAVAVIVEGGGAGAQRAVPMGGELMGAFLNSAR